MMFPILLAITFLQAIQYSGYQTETCPDLSISELQIVEEKRKCLIVQYTVTNTGNSDVNLFGELRSKNDNIAIQAYFSGDRRLNKGDVLGDGVFITGDVPILKPDSSFSSVMEISLKEKTNHVGVLILKVDATHRANECDETNNTNFLIMEW